MSARESEQAIERLLAGRTGRDAVYVPSGRIGIYIALRTWLSPGDRILMSPLDDDVVLFTVLAAGLRPVMAPLDAADANIDPAGIDEATWASLDAVLTTNLYGLPDRVGHLRARCRQFGLVLVEDAAHALHTDVGGRAVGGFGDVAVFSLSKHAAGVGGAIVADRDRRAELERLREQLVSERPLRIRASDALRPRLLAQLGRLGLRAPLRSARTALGGDARSEHRMALRPARLRSALAAAPDLIAFDPWLRVDKHDYRLVAREPALAETVRRLRSGAVDREARIGGAARLRELPAAAPAVREGEAQPLYRVPLLVEDRDGAGALLEAAGHPLHYVYAPPLDDYAGEELVEPSPSPGVARWWAQHVLPVDPLLAETALEALGAEPDLLRPAAAPPRSPRRDPPAPP